MPTDSPSTPSQGRREVAMGLIRLVRECTDFPIHKHAAHVIRKVDRHPVTGKWRAEGWKTGEQLRFRHQIRRVLGSRVDINRLFERLEPTRWRGDDIADAFWTFFLRNVHGADAFPDVVNVKQELLVKKTNNTSSSTSPRGTEPYALTRATTSSTRWRDAWPDQTKPSRNGSDSPAGTTCAKETGTRANTNYRRRPHAPSPRLDERVRRYKYPIRTIRSASGVSRSGPQRATRRRRRMPRADTSGEPNGKILKKMQSGRSRMTSTRAVTRTGRTPRFEPPTGVAEHAPRPNSSSPTSKRRGMMDTNRRGMMNTNRRRREPISWWPLRR